MLLACTFCIITLKREVKPLEVDKKQYFQWMLSYSLNKIESTPVCRSTEPQDILPEQKRWGVKELKLTTISSNLTSLGRWPWYKVNTLWGALTCESNRHGGGKEPRFPQHVYFLHQTTSDTRRLLYIYRIQSILPSTDIMHSAPLFKPYSDALQYSSHLGRHLTGTQCRKTR